MYLSSFQRLRPVVCSLSSVSTLLFLMMLNPIQAQDSATRKLVTVEIEGRDKPVQLDGIKYSNGKFDLDGTLIDADKIVHIEVDASLCSNLRAENQRLQSNLTKAKDKVQQLNHNNPDSILDKVAQMGGKLDQDSGKILSLEKENQTLRKTLDEQKTLAEQSVKTIKRRDQLIVELNLKYKNLRQFHDQKIKELNSPDFQAVVKVSSVKPQGQKMTRVEGEVYNPTKYHFDTIIVEVIAFDNNGARLAETTTFFKNYLPKEMHYFTCDLNITPEKIATTKVRAWPADQQ